MNYKYYLILTCFIAIFSLSSFKSRNLINTAARIKSDSTGRPVNLDSAQACINRFATEMQKHGFSDVAGQKVNIRITKTSQITTGESFSAEALQKWLSETMAAYSAAGKTLKINVQMGIYDSTYLNTYEPNSSARKNSVGRIAIFLIPYDATTPGLTARALVQPNGSTGGTGSGGGTGFDFGGLQP